MHTAATQQHENATPTYVVVIAWILRSVTAVILLQTLFFKFSAAPESVYIFMKVHAEPWGRIGSGILELIASVLILWPRFTWAGALIACGVMAGALLSHLTVLGIEVQGDGGLLFGLALTVLLSSVALLYITWSQIPFVGGRLQ
ncbi:MAG TPA: DoxX family protein [Terriglobales bacterium]|nr:DoxX family protein [Terriglobales bacterium]